MQNYGLTVDSYDSSVSTELTTTDTALLAGMGAFLIGFLIVSIIFSIIYYVAFGLAYQKLAQREGRSFWWAAWVPLVNAVALPLLAKDDVHPSIRGNNFVYLYIGSYFALMFLNLFIPLLPMLILLAIYFYPFFIIARKYSHSYILHTVVAVITMGISIPISLFRFKEPVYYDNNNMYDDNNTYYDNKNNSMY